MKHFLALILVVTVCGSLSAQDRSDSADQKQDESKQRQRDQRDPGNDRRRDTNGRDTNGRDTNGRDTNGRDTDGRDTDGRNTDGRERRASGRERAAANRNGRASRKVEVKDPAEFLKLTDDSVFSGPQAGENLPPFKATGLAGEIKDQEIDPIATAGSKPHILLMQDDEGVGIRGLLGMVRLLSKLDSKIEPAPHITCVFLTDDVEKTTAGANRFGKMFLSAGLDALVVSKDGREGPGTYGLNRNVSQTVLLAKDGKVTHNFVFPQGSLYADPHVLGGVAELLGVEKEKLATWLNETPPAGDRMARAESMRRDVSRTRDQSPATSGKTALRAKLEKLVEAEKLTREEAIDLYQTAFPEDKTRDGDRR